MTVDEILGKQGGVAIGIEALTICERFTPTGNKHETIGATGSWSNKALTLKPDPRLSQSPVGHLATRPL